MLGRARLVRRPPRAGRAGGEPPGVHQRAVAARSVRTLVGDEALDDVRVATGHRRAQERLRRRGRRERAPRRPRRASSAAGAAPSTRGRRASSRAPSRSASTRWPSSRRISRLTPMRPISASGWRTDVSRGVTITACSVSSKPTTREVVGDAKAAVARRVQRADRDVVVEPEDRRRRIGQREQLARPPRCRPRNAPVGVDDQLRVEQDARAASAARKPMQALLGRVPARGAGDRADAPVAERRAGARSPASRPTRASPRRTAMPSGGGSRGSTTTNGKPWRCSICSSSADSSGSIRIAPSVVPRISRSSSETSRSCSCSVGAEHDAHVAARTAPRRRRSRIGPK